MRNEPNDHPAPFQDRSEGTWDPLGIQGASDPAGPVPHWFAPLTVASNGLDRRTVEKLGLIWIALYKTRLDADGRMDLAVYPLNPNYSYLSAYYVSFLRDKGIPARSNTPARFSFPDVLLPALPANINRERFFNNLVDVLYCYWAVHVGLRLFEDHGFLTMASDSEQRQQETLSQLARQYGLDTSAMKQRVVAFMSRDLLVGKWYADATIVRLRAMWDKMLTWVSRDFYQQHLPGRTWESRTSALAKYAGARDAPSRASHELLQTFIAMCNDIQDLRAYRDNDLHGISHRVVEALGREDRDLNMAALWDFMIRETHRATEARDDMFCLHTVSFCRLAHGVGMTSHWPLSWWQRVGSWYSVARFQSVVSLGEAHFWPILISSKLRVSAESRASEAREATADGPLT